MATDRANDRGYALVAAVTSVAALAYVAFQVLAANTGGIANVTGRLEQARLAAAADAGIYLAIHGLAIDDRGERWTIDGRPRRLEFGDDTLTIVVQDERGKAPLASLTDAQARVLFGGGGASANRLDALVAEFRDWQTENPGDDDPNAVPPNLDPVWPVRHGPIRTVGELAGLRDMTPAIFARVAPSVTVFFEESGPFESSHATPLAIAAVAEQHAEETPDQLDETPTIDQDRPDIDIAPDDHYQGRTLTVKVLAQARDGAHTQRMAIVELTGGKTPPYWIRYVE